MTPERWERIQTLYHAARMLPEGDRRTFLADRCQGDPALEHEVQKLLDQPVSTGGFKAFIGDSAAAPPASARRQDLTGRQLGGYRVTSLLGRGGMGEVYRAHDSRLGREVAIKVLPTEFIADAGRRARFESEARMLAALNHPHIGAIFGVEDAAGFPALVLELVDGETLAERLRRGPLAVHDALGIARQIADALDAAHRKRIVHRDLKPANIKITPDGVVKVLDFGLAKAAGLRLVAEPEHPQAATGGLDATRVGTLLGTAAYMSPEQARGLPVDTRTDVWAFGCVLYEMLAGELAIGGQTLSETLAAILEREPDWSRLPAATPPRIRTLLRDCLQRDVDQRVQNIGDARATIDAVQRGRNRWQVTAIAAAAVAVVVTIAGLMLFRSAAQSGPIASSADYVQLTDLTESAVTPSLSPDGRMVTFKVGDDFFFGRGRIYVRPLPTGASVPLTPSGVGMYGPVFNHDGTGIAYTQVGNGWDTFTVPVQGGEPVRLLANASGLTYLSKDRVLFAEVRGALHMGIVSSTEQRATPRDVYFPPHELGMAHFASASPDRQWILVVEMDQTHAFGLPCRLVPADGSSRGRAVGPQGTCTAAAWSPDGLWMYFAAAVGGRSHLWRQRFPDGTPEQVTTGPTEEEGLAVAPDGRSLITALGIRRSSIWIHDAAGDRAIVAEGFAQLPRLSRDGRRVFFLLRPSAESDSFELRSLTLATGAIQTLIEGVPIIQYDISPDESGVAFTTRHGGTSQIWVAPIDRRRPPTRIASEADQVSFGAGDEVLYRSIQPSGNRVIRASKDGTRQVELQGPPYTKRVRSHRMADG